MIINILFFIILTYFIFSYLYQEINAISYAPPDAILHIIFSFVITIILFIVISNIKNSIELAFKFSGIVAFSIGTLKEIYDLKIKKTGFSFKDLKNNLFGICYGLLVMLWIITFMRLFNL